MNSLALISPLTLAGTVFLDQAYWLGAIASRPSASYKGYILGGLLVRWPHETTPA